VEFNGEAVVCICFDPVLVWEVGTYFGYAGADFELRFSEVGEGVVEIFSGEAGG